MSNKTIESLFVEQFERLQMENESLRARFNRESAKTKGEWGALRKKEACNE